jgi:hypothetical protein
MRSSAVQETSVQMTSRARRESMPAGLNFDLLIDAFAERVARKILAVQNGEPVMKQRLWTLEQAATYLACTPTAIRHKVTQGKLTPTKIDRKLRFDIGDLDRLIDEGKDAKR